MNEVLEASGEPYVLLDDLYGFLYDTSTILFKFGQPPAGISSRPGFLWDGKGNAFFKRSCHESTFSIP